MVIDEGQDAAPQAFEMLVERSGDAAVLRLRGEFDISRKREFEEHWRRLVTARLSELTVDLRHVTFMDSTALGLVLELWSWSRRAGCDFVVLRAPDRVHSVFEMAGLVEALPIVDSPPEA
jgi:anti-sigma B factor antagonist